VDKGAKAFAGHPGEKITEGSGWAARPPQRICSIGFALAKWRAVITIGRWPTQPCLHQSKCAGAGRLC